MVRKRIDVLVNFRQNVVDFAKQISNTKERFKGITNEAGKANRRFKENRTTLGRLGHRLRMVTHGLRGFRMEMLGVMFFGMGIQRFFQGLLKPAMQMAGVFDLINQVLGIVFLPIVLALLDPLLALSNWLINLSDDTKLLLGKIVLFGAILGGALFIIGMFALGIGSIILAFGGLLGIVEKLFPEPLGDFAASFLGLGIAAKAIEIAKPVWEKIKELVKNVWNKLKESPEIKKLLDDLGVSMEFLKNPWDKIKEKAKEFFDDLREKIGLSDEDIKNYKSQWDDLKTKFEEFVSMLKNDLIPVLKDLAGVAKDVMDTGIFDLVKYFVKGVKIFTGFASPIAKRAIEGSPFSRAPAVVGGAESILRDIYSELVDINQNRSFLDSFKFYKYPINESVDDINRLTAGG